DGGSDLALVGQARDGRQAGILVSRDSELVARRAPLPPQLLGRTPAIAGVDGDGLLDLFIAEDRYGETGGVLLRNEGDFSFADVTAQSGLEGVFALGATAADLDRDGHPDIVASDRMFFGTGDMTFAESTPREFGWSQIGPDDDPAGVAVGDFDNDGLPD